MNEYTHWSPHSYSPARDDHFHSAGKVQAHNLKVESSIDFKVIGTLQKAKRQKECIDYCQSLGLSKPLLHLNVVKFTGILRRH